MAEKSVHPSAVIAADADIGAGVCVGPCAVIESGAVIGENSVIGAHAFIGRGAVIGTDCQIGVGVVLRDGVVLERGVRLGDGVVLGTDGFGYVFDGSRHVKIPQVGQVRIGADSVIEACTCIDRATTGVTSVGANTHIGPMVMIGHNSRIGSECQIGFQAGFAGSSVVGDNCVMAPQSAMAMHSVLGDNCKVEFRCAVLRKFADGSHIAGYPARPVEEVRRLEAAVLRLPKLLKELEQ